MVGVTPNKLVVAQFPSLKPSTVVRKAVLVPAKIPSSHPVVRIMGNSCPQKHVSSCDVCPRHLLVITHDRRRGTVRPIHCNIAALPSYKASADATENPSISS